MNSILDKLPTILTLAVLVGIFLALRSIRHFAHPVLDFAWALIFIHFLIQVFETHTGTIEQIVESIDLGALELSGVVFVVSMAVRWRTISIGGGFAGAFRRSDGCFMPMAMTFGWHIRGGSDGGDRGSQHGGAMYAIVAKGFAESAMAISQQFVW